MEETRFTESGENASETKDERSAENEQLEYMKSGSVVSRRDGESVHCLTIIGQIEGHYTVTDGSKATKYEHIIPLLVSVEESDDIDGMLMVLNTMGGDVRRWSQACRSPRCRSSSAAVTRSACRLRSARAARSLFRPRR